MIDEKINKSLKELESQLKKVKSASTQVQSIVNSFDDFKTTTSNYINSLESIKTKLDDVVRLIGEDNKKKTQSFENDCAKFVKSATDLLEKVDNRADEIKNNVDENIKFVQSRLLYTLIFNILIFIALIAMFFAK